LNTIDYNPSEKHHVQNDYMKDGGEG